MPEFLKRWLGIWGIKKMLKKLSAAIAGKKTYGTAITGILFAVAAYLWGPFDIGGVEIPQLELKEAASLIWGALLATFLHAKKTP